MNEGRRGPREQEIERARFFVRRVARARYAFCARRVCAVWRELRSPARGVRTSGALVPYTSLFLVFPVVAPWSRDGRERRWMVARRACSGRRSSLFVANDAVQGRHRCNSAAKRRASPKKIWARRVMRFLFARGGCLFAWDWTRKANRRAAHTHVPPGYQGRVFSSRRGSPPTVRRHILSGLSRKRSRNSGGDRGR